MTDPHQKAEIMLEELQCLHAEDTEAIPWLRPAKKKMPNIKVTKAGVRKLLLKIKPHKAAVPDRIPNRVLK